ncbi:MAG: hypothetical protein NTZ69_17480 [Bacteroidia bacterium]|nr:hypothetical protein [Bacteroidia bacterium]
MKYFLFFCIIVVTCFACVGIVSETPLPEISVAELANYKMKILPDVPTSSVDVKLVIYEDCKYNRLNKVERNGNIIDIEKQFNSMIMAPCMLTNDTIPIGKLPAGTYRVNYKLVDLSTVTKNKIPFAIAFKLIVTN